MDKHRKKELEHLKELRLKLIKHREWYAKAVDRQKLIDDVYTSCIEVNTKPLCETCNTRLSSECSCIKQSTSTTYEYRYQG